MCLSTRREKLIKKQVELKTQNWLKRMRLNNSNHTLTQQTIDDKRAKFESQLRELASQPRNARRMIETAK